MADGDRIGLVGLALTADFPKPGPTWEAVLVVVVIDGFERIAFGILVVDKTARIGDKSLGRILRLEAIDLTVDEIRVGVLPEAKPSCCAEATSTRSKLRKNK